MSRQKYDSLRFRIHNLPLEVNLFKEFPELDKHPELKTKKQDFRILRYLIYMFDPKSDLLRDVPQLQERKEQALKLAGFDREDGKFEKSAQDILDGKHETIRDMSFIMISKVYHDRKFREWHTLYQELDEYTLLRWKPIDEEGSKDELAAAEKKSKLRAYCDAIHSAIDAIEKTIFGDSDDVKEFAIEVLLTSPERVAMAYSNQHSEL